MPQHDHRRQATVSPCYTGVGSRETPAEVVALMQELGALLASAGYTLRSGGADGADLAFEHGARRVSGASLEIYLPYKGFNNNPSMLYDISEEAYQLASTVHPVWHQLGYKSKQFHARNCYQVLGLTLDSPSEFLIAWTADGCESEASRNKNTGGTATAIALAERHRVPIFNLAREDSRARLADFLAHRGIKTPPGLAAGFQASLF